MSNFAPVGARQNIYGTSDTYARPGNPSAVRGPVLLHQVDVRGLRGAVEIAFALPTAQAREFERAAFCFGWCLRWISSQQIYYVSWRSTFSAGVPRLKTLRFTSRDPVLFEMQLAEGST